MPEEEEELTRLASDDQDRLATERDSIKSDRRTDTDSSDRMAADPVKDSIAEVVTDLMAKVDPRETGATEIETEAQSSSNPVMPFEDPIPARMLNEYVYCPRLFYYEFVEGVFVHNADTLRGAGVHKRVDAGEGELPKAETSELADSNGESSEPDTIHSRSVSLGSDRLGVTAKLDLVEVRREPDNLFSEMTVCPVDYKAGYPRESEEGEMTLWDADKMQLGLQCLLLRDNGYTCEEGVIYYRRTKQRVRLPVTPELEQWILETLEAARRCASGPIPAPLEDSPKCPRCSLVTVCLPDETVMLQEEKKTDDDADVDTEKAVRRLIAARDDERALYLNTPGAYVGRSGEVLKVTEREGKKKKKVAEVPINDLSHVALFGNIQITTSAIQILCRKEIPVSYFSSGGWFYGMTRGHQLKNVFVRMRQFALAEDPSAALRLSRKFVAGKIRNQRTLLMRNHAEPPGPALKRLKRAAADNSTQATSREALLGIEGAAASVYFKYFAGMIKANGSNEPEDDPDSEAPPLTFDFTRRNRRPPRDPVNALLSLAYSLLAKDCAVAAAAVGFDPYVGFFHQPRFGRPALALDVMEEFRPLVADSAVLTAINNRMLRPKDFVRAGDAVNLSTDGRKRFFEAYERRINTLVTHPLFDYQVSYRRALELQFRILARVITDEVAEYVPFCTR